MEKVNREILGIYVDNHTSLEDILCKINDKRIEIVDYEKDEYLTLTIKDFILSNLKKDTTLKKVKQSLIMSGLTNKEINSDPMSLTDSEKYKLLVARSLINNPDTLVLCFPNIYLDDYNLKRLLQLLNKLIKDLNKKVYIISNDLDFIYKECENIIIYKSRNIIFSNNRKKLYENKEVLLKNNIDLPLILNFISLVEKNKNIKLRPTYDIKELMKDIYRNV